jgi:hypothetical protein
MKLLLLLKFSFGVCFSLYNYLKRELIMNKNTYYLAILGMLIAGCGSNNQTTNNFSFEGLSLNLNSTNQVGVYKKATPLLERRMSSGGSNVNQNESYLVGYNNEGEVIPLIYTNDANEEVIVPYSVFSFEVVGDFSYIVYYNPSQQSNLESLEYTISTVYGPGNRKSSMKPLGVSTFELLLRGFGHESLHGKYAFIVAHNESGKLFDAVNLLSLGYWGNDDLDLVYLSLLAIFEDRINYFVRKGDTCGGELVFDKSNLVFNKTEVCTKLDIEPIFSHSSGYFLYTFNNNTYYSSPDFTITGLFTHNPEKLTKNVQFKSVNQSVVMLSSLNNKFFILGDNFEFIDEHPIQPSDSVVDFLSNSYWLFNKDGVDYFESDENVYSINFQSMETKVLAFEGVLNPLEQYDGRFKNIVFDNNLFTLATSIQTLSDASGFVTIENEIYQIKNSIENILKTGYVEYSKAIGLTQTNKSLNLQTGEIYLESESRPTITVTQVQPIN